MRPLRVAVLTCTLAFLIWFSLSLLFIETTPAEPFVSVTSYQDNALRNNISSQSNKRAIEIKAAFEFAWRGYSDKAFGHDEVGPVSGMATQFRIINS